MGGAVQARFHQVCFEAPPLNHNGAWLATGIFGCAVDGAGTCTIHGNWPIHARSPTPIAGVAAPGHFVHFVFPTSSGRFTARIRFDDGAGNVVRDCEVHAGGRDATRPGWASPGAVLTGFSTDASGLVTSAVWRSASAQNAAFSWHSVQVPTDFVAVGGGGAGVAQPAGALLSVSAPYVQYPGDVRTWRVRTSEAGGVQQPHVTTAYAIGLRIAGLAASNLAQQLQVTRGYAPHKPLAQAVLGPASPAYADAVQPVIGGSVVLGGGFQAMASVGVPAGTLIGQFAYLSEPLHGRAIDCPRGPAACEIVPWIIGWSVASKDHIVAAPGSIEATMLALPRQLTVNGKTYRVLSRHVTATSGQAAHPAADVSGLRGQYALTGIGASVAAARVPKDRLVAPLRPLKDAPTHVVAPGRGWNGSLLWKLEPRPDLGGASVAAKDHVVPWPAQVTAHAIGIRLEP